MGVRGEGHVPAALLLGMTRYPLYSWLGGPQGRSGRVRNISTPPRFDPRTVQALTRRYTGLQSGILQKHIQLFHATCRPTLRHVMDVCNWVLQHDSRISVLYYG